MGKKRYDYIEEVDKFNPYHGEHGRFSSSNGATFMTIDTKSPAGQKAIANIKTRNSAGGGKALANPTGNYEKDRKREWEGADYAVQFRDDGRYGSIDLRSTKTTDTGASYAEGAYGNMKIYAANDGSGWGKIYMADKASLQAAKTAANKKINDGNITDRKQQMSVMEAELADRALRTITRDYINEQRAARRK